MWGLGCDAEAPPAVEALYKLKGREAGKPSIVLVADLAMLQRYAAEVPAELEAMLAADTRPTTYILPASRAVAPEPGGARWHRGPARGERGVLP